MTPTTEELILPLKDIKPNPKNPRYIQEDKLDSLIKSIQEFPEMVNIRPLVINQDNILLGGNQRYKALTKLGYTEVKVIKVYNLTTEQENEFLIKDNIGYGEWNWETLLTDKWNIENLDEWGIEFPEWVGQDNLDIILDGLEPKTTNQPIYQTINLTYDTEDYNNIINGLMEINKDINEAVLTLLNLTTDGEN